MNTVEMTKIIILFIFSCPTLFFCLMLSSNIHSMDRTTYAKQIMIAAAISILTSIAASSILILN